MFETPQREAFCAAWKALKSLTTLPQTIYSRSFHPSHFPPHRRYISNEKFRQKNPGRGTTPVSRNREYARVLCVLGGDEVWAGDDYTQERCRCDGDIVDWTKRSIVVAFDSRSGCLLDVAKEWAQSAAWSLDGSTQIDARIDPDYCSTLLVTDSRISDNQPTDGRTWSAPVRPSVPAEIRLSAGLAPWRTRTPGANRNGTGREIDRWWVYSET